MGGKGSGRRKGSGGKSTRSILYTISKLLGDFGAIGKGRTGKRIGRRTIGRMFSRTFMRWIFVAGLLIPVYEPGQVLIPKFFLEQSPTGEIKIYDSNQILIPRYIVKPTDDGYDIFEAGKPMLPLFQIPKPITEGE